METATKAIQECIMHILKWDEQRYADQVYNCGITYLHHYIGEESEAIISEISRSKTFWNWWKHHWKKRDEEFVDMVIAASADDNWHLLYYEKHDARTLANAIYPSGVVLEESYDSMMQQLQKEVMYA
jgi:hypothetical protein